ncbi:putative ABC transporter permease [Haliovirga abyssi]|uniref:HD domain-containing protein n=1 Tax=Haliovirga abyssi TaxID=2996794 RepID=A0AAU9E494_9FUSO|nr:hypothetical protein [Haliovirga abyssi]BDU51315.1 hypothetical protein HLVA_18840 [Haliovirga abyssi]
MENIFYVIMFFTIYSFLGWILEVVYRSYRQKRFVNAGFLMGPFTPIYGIGALTVVWINNSLNNGKFDNIALKSLIFFIILTIIEYIVGELLEMIYKVKLWDYSKDRFNIGGKVCLKFSLAWMVLAIIFNYEIHPFFKKILYKQNPEILEGISVMMILYFITDLIISSNALSRFKRKILFFKENHENLNNLEIEKIFLSTIRLTKAFPNLSGFIYKNISDSLSQRVGKIISLINSKKIEYEKGKTPSEEEYYNIVKDIIENKEFLKLKNFYHHNSSIYKHVLEVSYLSYKISKYIGADYKSTARGGLLHDFFLYDWRNHSEPDLAKNKLHGFAHPKIALKNSEKNFKLNKIEKDIIIKHMWPLTIIPPRYKESFIVTFVDKYLATKEFATSFTGKLKNILD